MTPQTPNPNPQDKRLCSKHKLRHGQKYQSCTPQPADEQDDKHVWDFVEPCEPDCSPERHAYHQGQWDLAKRMSGSDFPTDATDSPQASETSEQEDKLCVDCGNEAVVVLKAPLPRNYPRWYCDEHAQIELGKDPRTVVLHPSTPIFTPQPQSYSVEDKIDDLVGVMLTASDTKYLPEKYRTQSAVPLEIAIKAHKQMKVDLTQQIQALLESEYQRGRKETQND